MKKQILFLTTLFFNLSLLAQVTYNLSGQAYLGCMDSLACNFNSDANTDDGLCVFAEEGYDCQGNITSNLSSFEWTQLIDSPNLPSDLNKSSFGFDRSNRLIYFVNINTNELQVYSIDDNEFYTLNINSWPGFGSSGSFIYHPEKNVIQAFRAGTDDVYQVIPSDGASWELAIDGSYTSNMYGSDPFYNGTSGNIGVMNGYGWYQVRNWVFEEANGMWSEMIPNTNSEPYKRMTDYLYPNEDFSKLYMIDGQGSQTGDQWENSCSLGDSWATDIGTYCWLKDVWELDLETYEWSNVLPVNSNSVNYIGTNAFDYENNTLYKLGGYIPAPSYQGDIETTNESYKLQIGEDTAYVIIDQYGDIPPGTNEVGVSYFDEQENQLLIFRSDGVWKFSLDNSTNVIFGCQDELASNYNQDESCSYYNTYPIDDLAFLNYLLENYPDCIVNDSLNLDALGGITNLNLDGLNISSLDGIQYFDDLISLNCDNNNLISIPTLPDGLISLSCSGNQLTEINTLPTGLTSFSCDNNNLIVLPVLPVSLTYLSCSGNQLTEINTLPTGLTSLICDGNNLADLPELPDNLTNLSCGGNDLEILVDLPDNLTSINIEDNPIICVGSYPYNLNGDLSDYLPCQYGCMEVSACNFNENALVTDSNCVYSLEFYNCSGVCENDTDGDGFCDQLEVYGCTDVIADNYDSLATENSGCLIDTGCSIETACNYSSYVVNNDLELCVFPPDFYQCVEVISSSDGTISYDFICNNDTDGDGLCDEYEVLGCIQTLACNYNPDATQSDNSCVFSEPNFDCQGDCVNDADSDGVCDAFEILGCTDTLYLEFDSNATDDNGFCQTIIITGCTNPIYIEFNEGANVDDESCETIAIEGCTDSLYLEYSQEFNLDNGSCLNLIVEGCMDSLYLEFNPEANLEDQSCQDLMILGCTDTIACNFDQAANSDNELCLYPEIYFDCEGICLADIDSDGVCDELEIYGCYDSTACNYQPLLTELEDCEYLTVSLVEEVFLEDNQYFSVLIAYNDGLNSSYTWFEASEEISSSNNDTLFVEQNGDYFVQVYDQDLGCYGSDTIAVKDFNLNTLIKQSISIYPNPTFDKVNIEIPTGYTKIQIELIDLTGTILMSKITESKSITKVALSLAELVPQMCFVRIHMNDLAFTYPLVIQQK